MAWEIRLTPDQPYFLTSVILSVRGPMGRMGCLGHWQLRHLLQELWSTGNILKEEPRGKMCGVGMLVPNPSVKRKPCLMIAAKVGPCFNGIVLGSQPLSPSCSSSAYQLISSSSSSNSSSSRRRSTED